MAFWRRSAPAPSERPGGMLRLAGWTQGIFDGLHLGPRGGIRADGGFGGDGDRTANATWSTSTLSRYELESLRKTSWAARRVVEVPVADAFAKWRTFVSETDGAEEAMAAAEKLARVKQVLSRAWVAGRLHGTACAVLVTREAPMDEELVAERIRPGDLLAIHVLDHWSMTATEYDEDWTSPGFGYPTMWNLTTRFGTQMDVHPSRLLIFYGDRPLTAMGTWEGAAQRGTWAGTSVLESVLRAINAEELSTSATAHGLMQNALMILKSESLADRRTENPAAVKELLSRLNRMAGLSTLLIDNDEEAQRLTSAVSGAAPALTAIGKRVAWAAGIPEARFLGVPGGGFSSSEPEHLAYSEHIRSLQEAVLAPILDRLDPIVARNAGLAEAPEYEWTPLVTLAEDHLAETAMKQAGVAALLTEKKLATLDEARTWLREHEGFDDALEEETPDELQQAAENGDGEPEGGEAAPDAEEPDGGGEVGDDGEDADE